MTPDTLTQWRENAERMQTVNWQGEPVADRRILALIDALEDMTREARLSREATERAVRREARLRERVAYLARVYAVAPNEPRCCSDCAANDISDELREALADAADTLCIAPPHRVVLCSCGKPAAHTSAPEDSTEWGCRVPDFDRQTGRILRPPSA